MCIMLSEEEPKSTRLIKIPVIKNEKEHTLLFYTNDIKVEENDNAIMVVPIPNPNKLNNFTLVSASDPNIKQFRESLVKKSDNILKQIYSEKGYSKPLSKSRNMSLFRNMADYDDYIDVERVGNYDISVAPDYNKLISSINWEHFKKPFDFDKRLATLKNNSYFKTNMAFVVAKAVSSVSDDGFGIIYPNDNLSSYDYFPIIHEDTDTLSPQKNFNVMCYDFQYDKKYNSLETKLNKQYQSHLSYRVPLVSNPDNTYKPRTFTVKLDDFNKKTMVGDYFRRSDVWNVNYRKINYLNITPIINNGLNQNIWNSSLEN